MRDYPEVVDPDPENVISQWDNESIAEAGQRLMGWHESQAARYIGVTNPYCGHRDAAEVLRELIDRLPPFPLHYFTVRNRPEPDRTTVEIAGHKVYRRVGIPFIETPEPEGIGSYELARAILEACERAHAEGGE